MVFVDAAAPDDKVAAVVGPVAFALMSLLGGFFLNLDSLPFWFGWLQHLSLFRYSFAAIMQVSLVSVPLPLNYSFAAIMQVLYAFLLVLFSFFFTFFPFLFHVPFILIRCTHTLEEWRWIRCTHSPD